MIGSEGAGAMRSIPAMSMNQRSDLKLSSTLIAEVLCKCMFTKRAEYCSDVLI